SSPCLRHQNATLIPYTTLFRSKESFKIIYSEDNKNLIRTAFSTDYFDGGIFDPARINFFQYFTLPDEENYKLADIRGRNKNFWRDRKSTRLNSSHVKISYAVFC